MPYNKLFQSTQTCSATEGYYSTLLHELTHWTKPKHRLNREGGKKFGDKDYAFEELTAEFGAAFLCAEFGISTFQKVTMLAISKIGLKYCAKTKRCCLQLQAKPQKRLNTYTNFNLKLLNYLSRLDSSERLMNSGLSYGSSLDAIP